MTTIARSVVGPVALTARVWASSRTAASTVTPSSPRRTDVAVPAQSDPSAVRKRHSAPSLATCAALTAPPPAGSSKGSVRRVISPGSGNTPRPCVSHST